MRGIALALTVAVASIVPAAAQYGQQGTGSATAAPTVTQNIAKGVLSEGAFVRHTRAVSGQPETVTVRSMWNGLPVLATFEAVRGTRWLLNGQRINWNTIQPGTIIAVPTNAKVWHATFDGSVDVGKISAIDTTNNTFTVSLPNGEIPTLRFSPDAIVIRNDHTDALKSVQTGETVLFEIPPGQHRVALFHDLGDARLASIAGVGRNGVALTFTEAGKQYTRTFSPQQGVFFYAKGRPILSANLAGAFQPGQQAWILGPTRRPRSIISDVGTGYQAAMVGTPPTVGVAPSAPGEEVSSTASTTTTPPATEVTPPSEVSATTVSTADIGTAFGQGTFQSYTPASGNMPAMATFSFNWNGQPVTATYAISPQDQWMYQGQAIDWSSVQPGTMVSIPTTARVANLSTGGSVGVGTVSSIDQTNNTITVTLPSGDTRTLRYSPQAILLQNGQPVMVSQLNPGDSVVFEIPSSGNQVALFTAVQPGIQGTVTSVSDNGIVVSYNQNGQMVSSTIPVAGQTTFFNNGQFVTASSAGTTFQPGSTVWIYGSPDNPQFVASNVTTGFETAEVTPVAPPTTVAAVPPTTEAVTTTTTTTRTTRVAGVRQRPYVSRVSRSTRAARIARARHLAAVRRAHAARVAAIRRAHAARVAALRRAQAQHVRVAGYRARHHVVRHHVRHHRVAVRTMRHHRAAARTFRGEPIRK